MGAVQHLARPLDVSIVKQDRKDLWLLCQVPGAREVVDEF